MKKLILVVLAVTLLAGSVGAQPKKKRVADKKFWGAVVVMIAASIADAESTVHWMKVCPTCRELNSWLYGRRPTRKRMYLTLLPIAAAEIWGMWWVKRDDMKQGTKVWMVIPIAHTAGHGGAAAYNYSKDFPRTCPALGAGCVSP